MLLFFEYNFSSNKNNYSTHPQICLWSDTYMTTLLTDPILFLDITNLQTIRKFYDTLAITFACCNSFSDSSFVIFKTMDIKELSCVD